MYSVAFRNCVQLFNITLPFMLFKYSTTPGPKQKRILCFEKCKFKKKAMMCKSHKPIFHSC